MTAFQRYAENLYARFPSAAPPRRNAFQNLKEGSARWSGISDKHYIGYLTNSESFSITRLFQRRHLLAHAQDIIDSDYATRVGDLTYQIGKRIVIREGAVRQFLSRIESSLLAWHPTPQPSGLRSITGGGKVLANFK